MHDSLTKIPQKSRLGIYGVLFSFKLLSLLKKKKGIGKKNAKIKVKGKEKIIHLPLKKKNPLKRFFYFKSR